VISSLGASLVVVVVFWDTGAVVAVVAVVVVDRRYVLLLSVLYSLVANLLGSSLTLTSAK
jgi:hypothetical protein